MRRQASHHLLTVVTCSLMSSLLTTTALAEGPVGERVAAGFAEVSRPDGQTMVIQQGSHRAIVNWDQFNIGADHAVRIIQPSADAAILNRVTGGDYSRIMGTLTANGTVALVNPEGILFGPDSVIDVGSLIATTHDIADADFMADRWVFDQPGNPNASIINQGRITAQEGGMAALVAPGVRNDGIIAARLGEVTMAASTGGFTLDFYGDQLIQLRVGEDVAADVLDVATGQPLSSLVDNQGELSASGGTVHLTATAARRVVDYVINNDGIIEADSVGMQNGLIVLGAATDVASLQQHLDQSVRISGEIRARGDEPSETGGQIQITGETIETARATINASGAAGGGDILLGGGLQGGDPNPAFLVGLDAPTDLPPIPTARSAIIDNETVFDASATEDGDGGNIIAWADDSMDFSGFVRSRGGQLGGDGGFVEVSGAQTLDFLEIEVDLAASRGSAGRILFDPLELYIGAHEAALLSNFISNDSVGVTTISGDHITIDGNIVRTRPTSSSGPSLSETVTLNLIANDGIIIEDGVTIGSYFGPMDIFIDADADISARSGEMNQAWFYYTERLLGELNDPFFGNPAVDFFSVPSVNALGNRALSAYQRYHTLLTAPDGMEISDFISFLDGDPSIPQSFMDEMRKSVFIDNGAFWLGGAGEFRVVDQDGTVSIQPSFQAPDSISVVLGSNRFSRPDYDYQLSGPAGFFEFDEGDLEFIDGGYSRTGMTAEYSFDRDDRMIPPTSGTSIRHVTGTGLNLLEQAWDRLQISGTQLEVVIGDYFDSLKTSSDPSQDRNGDFLGVNQLEEVWQPPTVDELRESARGPRDDFIAFQEMVLSIADIPGRVSAIKSAWNIVRRRSNGDDVQAVISQASEEAAASFLVTPRNLSDRVDERTEGSLTPGIDPEATGLLEFARQNPEAARRYLESYSFIGQGND